MTAYQGPERRESQHYTADDRELIERVVMNAVRAMTLKLLAGFGAFLLLQVATAIWWASGLDRQVVDNTADLSEISRTRYRQDDAARDFQLRDDRILRLGQSLDRIETTVGSTQAAVAQMGSTLAVIVSQRDEARAREWRQQ